MAQSQATASAHCHRPGQVYSRRPAPPMGKHGLPTAWSHRQCHSLKKVIICPAKASHCISSLPPTRPTRGFCFVRYIIPPMERKRAVSNGLHGNEGLLLSWLMGVCATNCKNATNADWFAAVRLFSGAQGQATASGSLPPTRGQAHSRRPAPPMGKQGLPTAWSHRQCHSLKK